MVCELELDPQETVDWARKWLLDFNAGKTQLVLFDRSNNTGAIGVKMNGSVLEEKSSCKFGADFLFKIGLGLLRNLYC